jgi:hypothetical protein
MSQEHAPGRDAGGATTAGSIDNPAPELLTQKETAKLLRISVRSLERWRVEPPHSDPLPYIKLGRRVLYARDTTIEWLKRRTFTSTSQADQAA